MLDVNSIKKILNVTKPNMWLYAGSIGLIVFASLFEVFGISLIIPIINSFAAGGDFTSNLKVPYLAEMIKITPFHSDIGIFTFLLLLVLASVVASNFFLLVSLFCLSKFSTDFLYILKNKILERYFSFGKAFYDRAKPGHLVWVLANSTDELGGALVGLRSMSVNIIMAIAFLVFMFAISWQLAISALPLMFIIYYSLNWLIRKISGSAAGRYLGAIDLVAYSTDLLSNIALVRSYTNEDNEYKKFVMKSDILRFHSFNLLKKAESVPLFTNVIATMGFLAIVFICVVFYMKKGAFPIGKFLVFFFVLKNFVTYVKPLNELKSLIAKMEPLIKNIGLVFDDSDKVFIKSGTIDSFMLKDRIVFRDVSFGYGRGEQVLKNISFTVKKGQMVAIVGPTGAGKTTIAHLLCRFYDCDSGAIEIDGININNLTLRALRSSIALVAQDNPLFHDSIRNNITYGMNKKISSQELDEVAKKAYLYDYIMRLPDKYDTLVGDKGVKLSGGEKQRVSIARAILKNEDILILDEATSSLDSETERLIQKALDGLTETKTVIAIAHRLSTIKNADWILVLENGEIKEQGELEDLSDRGGRFSYYWNLQKFH